MKEAITIKIQSIVEMKLSPIITKITNQRHLLAIRDGIALLTPLSIIGSLAMIIALPPIPTMLSGTTIFHRFLLSWKDFSNDFYSILIVPYYLSLGSITVYVVCGISYKLASSYKLNAINNTIAALFVFLCIAIFPNNNLEFSIKELGVNSMFSGILIAISVVEINRFCIDKGICIKFSKSVTNNVTMPFNLLIPLVINLVIFIGLNTLIFHLVGAGVTSFIYKVIHPLLSLVGTLPSILLINFLMTSFWFFGIHGANMISIITIPIMTSGLMKNAEAYANNQPLVEIYAGSVNSVFGNWITYTAFLIIMLFSCKSSALKSIAKVAMLPTLFNINEPMIFGIPTVFNVFTYIPLVICSIINFSTAYLLMKNGIINKFFTVVPFTMPAPLQAFFATMDYKSILLWFILLGVDVLICYPFMKIYDKQLVEKEKQ